MSRLAQVTPVLASEELEQEPGLVALVESTLTDAGWRMTLILKREERNKTLQVEVEFMPLLAPILDTPVQFTPVEFIDCVDDVAAAMRWQGKVFTAQFSRPQVSGFFRFRFEEPRSRNIQPSRRFYDVTH